MVGSKRVGAVATVAFVAWIAACGGRVNGILAGNDAGSPDDGGLVSVPDGTIIVVTVLDSGTSLPDATFHGKDAAKPPPDDDADDENDGGLDFEDAGEEACSPQTCDEQGLNCGVAGDGCGGGLECGECDAPTSCGGGGTPGVCGTAGPVDATGTWGGEWSAAGMVGSATMQLTQTGDAVTGAVTFDSEPCFDNAQLTGTLTGSELDGTLVLGSSMATIKAQINGNTMSGTIDVTAGGCSAVMGMFGLTR